jgi:hypothetical protein
MPVTVRSGPLVMGPQAVHCDHAQWSHWTAGRHIALSVG